jgi:antitoxin component YwqK of YwqJK toxin-antitoxin module
MRGSPKEFGLIGKVHSVETILVDTSTRSYRLRPGGRELLDDYANPSSGTPARPLLWELLKFDPQGKLMEDADQDRPVIEQESYRYVYTYDQSGRLIEKRGYKEDGSFDERVVTTYSPGGKKIEQLFYSVAGRISGRYKFDDHENIFSIEWYNEDGTVRRKEDHRYEYATKGNTTEQVYYPPERSGGLRRLTSSAVPTSDSGNPANRSNPPGHRTVRVFDDAGHVREESRYLPDGSLNEMKSYDEHGVLRKSEWRVGDLNVTTTTYNETGAATESHNFAKKGFGSPRAVDDHTVFSYDGHGNLTEMVTTAPDGSLVHRSTNIYEYDQRGNWITKTETELNNLWKTEPFPAAFETVREFRRTISYFSED